MEEISLTGKIAVTAIFIVCGIWLISYTNSRKEKIEKSIRTSYYVLGLVMIALPLILIVGL